MSNDKVRAAAAEMLRTHDVLDGLPVQDDPRLGPAIQQKNIATAALRAALAEVAPKVEPVADAFTESVRRMGIPYWQAALIERLTADLAAMTAERDIARRQRDYNREVIGGMLLRVEADLAAMTAKADANAKDAARYRWLRQATVANGSITEDGWWDRLGDANVFLWDDMIDAAIAKVSA